MDSEQRYFGRFRLDLRFHELLRDEKPVRLGSRALDILCALASADGEVVSKNELMARVWPGTVVEENNLHVHISALRKALDDEGNGQSCLVTVPGRGYRLVFPTTLAAPIALPVSGQRTENGVAVASPPPAAPRLSIVVLPFTNLSDDREQQYFADGITDDVTTDLSRIPHMFVISRNTAFTYKDKPVSAKLIGRELGVRYVLEGSVRRSGNRVRVNAQLIDAETDAHMWAERFDDDSFDLFALQDQVTSRIAVALNLELVGAEAARPTEHANAFDYILRGRAAVSNPRSWGTYDGAISLFERALALDPQSVAAQSWLALTLANRVINQMTDTTAADIARAEGLVGQALAASPRSAIVHFAKGEVVRAQRRYPEAIPEYEAVLAFDRNSAWALFALGHCKLMIGSIEEVIPIMEQAIRLNPRDPQIAVMYYRIGEVHLLQSRTEKAIAWLEKARCANPELSYVHGFLAAAHALKGETERAAARLAEARRLNDCYSSIAQLTAGYFWVPKMRALFERTYLLGLRKAGMPEE